MLSESFVQWVLLGSAAITAVAVPKWLDGRSWGPPWERAFAVVGIVFAFVLYVLPGIFAVRSYRAWRRGERRAPLLLVSWGLFWSAWMTMFMSVILAYGIFVGPVEM